MPTVLEYEQRRGPPTALRVVAVIFIAIGIASTVNMIVQIFHNGLFLDFNVLGIFCGPALLRRSRGWRIYAMVTLWIEMITAVIVAIAFLIRGGMAPILMSGRVICNIPAKLVSIPAAVIFLFALWQYRILIRADVVAFFRGKTGIPPPTNFDFHMD